MATYVMSDIHGLKERFDHVLEMIAFQPEDTLYILGDVIDRGRDGIALLQATMKHENIHLLMGNHEHMMLEYFDAMETIGTDAEDDETYDCIRRWNHNHNEPTLDAFSLLTEQEQLEMLDYLRNLPLALPDVEVNGRHFYLVHACPANVDSQGVIDLTWCKEHGEAAASFVWTRIPTSFQPPQGRILIYGHTITLFYQDVHPYAIWHNEAELTSSTLINIDCGCAADDRYTQLACLRLDDLEVFYG